MRPSCRPERARGTAARRVPGEPGPRGTRPRSPAQPLRRPHPCPGARSGTGPPRPSAPRPLSVPAEERRSLARSLAGSLGAPALCPR